MDFESVTTKIAGAPLTLLGPRAARLLLGIAALCLFATANAGQQLLVTAANADGDMVYNLNLAGTPPLISNKNGKTPLNKDGSSHGNFDALVWVPNSYTNTLDLIVADFAKGSIVYYSGPNYGTATTLFSWSKSNPGPSRPNGLSVDAAGNLFVVSSNWSESPTPGVWVLPFNSSACNDNHGWTCYGKPILIDATFSGVRTLALAESLVAQTTTPLWGMGDMLVLVGDSFAARVIVYHQASIAKVLAGRGPLPGPDATVVPWAKFLQELAVPFGMDVWPPDATHGTSLLFTTIDGRIIRFDTVADAFVGNFASGLGFLLQKIKVGTFASTPYAFVAQLELHDAGRILQFGAPPANGGNPILGAVSTGVSEPVGVAVISGADSTPVASCVSSSGCSLLNGAITPMITPPAGAPAPEGNLLMQSCVVQSDPRVTFPGGAWTCNGNETLDIANYCPGFPSTIIPGSVCGHSGSTGSGFAIVKGTALQFDPASNNYLIQVPQNVNVLLPGPKNLACNQPPGMPFPLLLWATRSDLPGVEGTEVEGNIFDELTGYCDSPGSITHEVSMFGSGFALNNSPSGLPNGLPGYVNGKFANLLAELPQQNIQPTVEANLQACTSQSQTYFNSGVSGNPNGFSCALNQLVQCHQIVTSNATSYQGSAFNSNLTPTGGNPSPAYDDDGRLASAYAMTSYTAVLPINPAWPPPNVPPCVTLTATPASVTAGIPASLSWTANGVPAGASCTLTATDGTFLNSNTHEPASASGVSTGKLVTPGTYQAMLTCPGTGTASGFATADVTVTSQPVLQSIALSPQAGSVAAGQTQQFTATGTYNVGNPQNITSSVTWASVPASVATVNASGLATCVASATGGAATISATGPGGVQGVAPLTCQAPTLTGVTLNTASATIEAQTSSLQLTATANYSDGATLTVTNNANTTWFSNNNDATVSATGLVAGVIPGTSTISATYPAGGMVGSASVTVTDFNITPPNPQSTSAGGTLTYALTVTGVQGFTDTVSGASCSLPTGLGSYSFSSPISLTPTGFTGVINVVLNVSASAPANTYPFSCTLTSGAGDSHTASLQVAVTGAGAPPTFTLPLTAAASTVANGGSTTLSWTATGVPSGSFCTLTATDGTFLTANTTQPASASGVSTGTLTITPTYTATLTCPGTGASSAQSVASVGVAPAIPAVTLTAALLNSPNAVVFGPNGNLYVASAGTGQVFAFSPASVLAATTGFDPVVQPVLKISAGLVTPVRLAFDAAGNLYVADIGNNSVLVYDPSGNPITTATIPVNKPLGVAVDNNGVVYVAENFNNKIDVFSYPNTLTSAPTLVTSWTGDSSGNTFLAPGAIAFNGTDIAIGAATGTFYNVTLYSPNSLQCQSACTLTPLTSITNGVSGPTGIAFDAAGDVYVSNYYTSSVGKYTPADIAAGAGPAVTATANLANPEGVAVDSSGNIYTGSSTPYHDNIAVYNSSGTYLKEFEPGVAGAGATPVTSVVVNASTPVVFGVFGTALPSDAQCTYTETGLSGSNTVGLPPFGIGAYPTTNPIQVSISCGDPVITTPTVTATMAVISPQEITTFGPSTSGTSLEWTTSNATSCTLTSSDGLFLNAPEAANGSVTLSETTGTYTFQLNCFGGAGTTAVQSSTTVSIP